jgi:multiphosphoryl transfer protein
VGVCGEMASDERAVGVLLGSGVRELSVSPVAVPAVKQVVRAVETAEAAVLAARALTAPDAAAVRALF